MNVRWIEFKDIVDKRNDERPMGHLNPIEGLKDVSYNKGSGEYNSWVSCT